MGKKCKRRARIRKKVVGLVHRRERQVQEQGKRNLRKFDLPFPSFLKFVKIMKDTDHDRISRNPFRHSENRKTGRSPRSRFVGDVPQESLAGGFARNSSLPGRVVFGQIRSKIQLGQAAIGSALCCQLWCSQPCVQCQLLSHFVVHTVGRGACYMNMHAI